MRLDWIGGSNEAPIVLIFVPRITAYCAGSTHTIARFFHPGQGFLRISGTDEPLHILDSTNIYIIFKAH
jgi:hypothetical protein